MGGSGLDGSGSRYGLTAVVNTVMKLWVPKTSEFLDFFLFRWRYSPLWALACRTVPVHFPLYITNSLHLLTPST